MAALTPLPGCLNSGCPVKQPRPEGPTGRAYAVRWALGISLLVAAGWTGTVAAQEVQWRPDYNAARREAQAKNRPLVLDFGTENCFWCKKLDVTTFQEPGIVELLNHRFVALKVDASRDAVLAEALRIQRYPTLVLAAPDGKILSTLEGYVDAARFGQHLHHVLAALDNPEWMNRDYQEAAKAVAASDYARAIALLRSILEDGRDRPVQGKARQLLGDLDQQANGRLARARQLDDKGQTAEAIHTVAELLRSFPGTPAAEEGGRLLTSLAARPEVNTQQRKRRAGELLAQAREDYRTQQYVGCLECCEILGTSYADLPEGTEAGQLAAEIRNNPEWLQQACQSLSERLGGLYLALADTWIKKGDTSQATRCLERVIQSFPGSRQADLAQVRLANLQGRSTWQAEFQKP